MNTKSELEILEKERRLFLEKNVQDIQDAYAVHDILLVCKLLVAYGSYESEYGSKYARLKRA